MKKIIIIVLALLLVAAGAVLFFLLQPEVDPEVSKSPYETGEYYITNIKDCERLLKTTIVLEVNKTSDDTEFFEFLKGNNHVIRNNIISILRGKTEDELRADDAMQRLAVQISASLNKTLGIDNVQTIYFNEYVLQ